MTEGGSRVPPLVQLRRQRALGVSQHDRTAADVAHIDHGRGDLDVHGNV